MSKSSLVYGAVLVAAIAVSGCKSQSAAPSATAASIKGGSASAAKAAAAPAAQALPATSSAQAAQTGSSPPDPDAAAVLAEVDAELNAQAQYALLDSDVALLRDEGVLSSSEVAALQPLVKK